MEYRKLGRTGVKVSEVSLGTMAFGRWIDEQASATILDLALDNGINLIDTANVYGAGESERILGNLLKERRQQIVQRGSDDPFAVSDKNILEEIGRIAKSFLDRMKPLLKNPWYTRENVNIVDIDDGCK